jgi:hypothetical protein
MLKKPMNANNVAKPRRYLSWHLRRALAARLMLETEKARTQGAINEKAASAHHSRACDIRLFSILSFYA